MEIVGAFYTMIMVYIYIYQRCTRLCRVEIIMTFIYCYLHTEIFYISDKNICNTAPTLYQDAQTFKRYFWSHIMQRAPLIPSRFDSLRSQLNASVFAVHFEWILEPKNKVLFKSQNQRIFLRLLTNIQISRFDSLRS